MNTRLKNAMIWVFGALGGILWGYDTGVISGAMLFIRKDIELTPLLEGMVVSGLLVGAMLGAGLSGIGTACQLSAEFPDKTITILERRERLGGTWDLFRYPGIRSDSDMLTFGYKWRPWHERKVLADGPSIRQYIADTARLTWKHLDDGGDVIFEGAQGTLLDIDHGTYPFVTSSNTVAGSTGAGSGMGPNAAGFVLGIVKAYTTRVGSGPFPTELSDETGQRLGERGHEFGTVTGRQRRCGWFDAVLVRQ